MWKPWQWAVTQQPAAISNARVATTDCSRRRLERADVTLYLAVLASAGRQHQASGLTSGTRRGDSLAPCPSLLRPR